jgi:hypothetical protein
MLLVLSTYWPSVWPSQERLARDMKVSRRHVNRLLLALEKAGLIVRKRRGYSSTLYHLKLQTIRECCDPVVPEVVTSVPHKQQEVEGSSSDPSDYDYERDPFEGI